MKFNSVTSMGQVVTMIPNFNFINVIAFKNTAIAKVCVDDVLLLCNNHQFNWYFQNHGVI